MSRYAVIDLGTNTFHLLIVDKAPDSVVPTEVYRYRRFVKLGEEGIQTLGAAPWQRAMAALRFFREQLDLHKVPHQHVVALGTAALRTATNGMAFLNEAMAVTGIRIQLISGDREAALIAKGVLLAIPPPEEKVLIMDIGGGSVEFIIADAQQIYWAQSFPVGVAVLYREFHHQEPISPVEMKAIEDFLYLQLSPLRSILAQYPIRHMVGAAGTFDVIADQLGGSLDNELSYHVPLDQFHLFFEKVLSSTRQQRYAMPEIPDDRADMIVVALILVEVVLKMAGINKMSVSTYSMKEGMLAELISRKEPDSATG